MVKNIGVEDVLISMRISEFGKDEDGRPMFVISGVSTSTLEHSELSFDSEYVEVGTGSDARLVVEIDGNPVHKLPFDSVIDQLLDGLENWGEYTIRSQSDPEEIVHSVDVSHIKDIHSFLLDAS